VICQRRCVKQCGWDLAAQACGRNPTAQSSPVQSDSMHAHVPQNLLHAHTKQYGGTFDAGAACSTPTQSCQQLECAARDVTVLLQHVPTFNICEHWRQATPQVLPVACDRRMTTTRMYRRLSSQNRPLQSNQPSGEQCDTLHHGPDKRRNLLSPWAACCMWPRAGDPTQITQHAPAVARLYHSQVADASCFVDGCRLLQVVDGHCLPCMHCL
jgi:hypothetical protein